MYRSFADVVTKSDLEQQAREAGLRPLTPPVTDGKPFNHVVERSEAQADYMEQIINRMEHAARCFEIFFEVFCLDDGHTHAFSPSFNGWWQRMMWPGSTSTSGTAPFMHSSVA